MTVSLVFHSKHKTSAVFHMPVVHALHADALSTQHVGYFLSYCLTAIVYNDNGFMFHISIISKYLFLFDVEVA